MESEKVKEIKEKLQEEIFIANSFGDKLRKVHTKELENILTLINELESENEKLLESCKNCHYIKDLEIANGHAKELKDRIAELEKENTEQLKQFAEMLKEKLKEKVNGYNVDFFVECAKLTSETLKEMIK